MPEISIVYSTRDGKYAVFFVSIRRLDGFSINLNISLNFLKRAMFVFVKPLSITERPVFHFEVYVNVIHEEYIHTCKGV